MMKYTVVEGKDRKDDDGEIVICSKPFCEHCMGLEPFTPMIHEDGTNWCLCCAECNLDIPENILKKAKDLSRDKKIEYFENRLKQLKEG